MKAARGRRPALVGNSSGELVSPRGLGPPIGNAYDYRALGRGLSQIGSWLLTPEGQRRYRHDPEVAAVVDEAIEIGTEMVKLIDFATAGNRVSGKYKITSDSFWALVWSQGASCAICSAPFEPGGTKMVVDHNHNTGAVRGVLCHACNTGLGMFRDSPDALEAALEYLEARGCYGPNALGEEDA